MKCREYSSHHKTFGSCVSFNVSLFWWWKSLLQVWFSWSWKKKTEALNKVIDDSGLRPGPGPPASASLRALCRPSQGLGRARYTLEGGLVAFWENERGSVLLLVFWRPLEFECSTRKTSISHTYSCISACPCRDTKHLYILSKVSFLFLRFWTYFFFFLAISGLWY